MPEMVSLMVLQHQIVKVSHQTWKDSQRIYSHTFNIQLLAEEFHYNARIAEKAPFTDAKSDPV